MRYLGGKSRLSKAIAEIVNRDRGDRIFWDPFCGGLSVSVRLAEHGPGIVSDLNPALIALYQAVRDGWDPPKVLSKEEHHAAKSLPDSDPLKAFAGFGCSFGAKWFGGYARSRRSCDDYAGATRRALLRDIPKLAGCAIEHRSFFDWTPRPLPLVIYCDPPYAGTAGYAKTGVFPHDQFWSRCVEWERAGVPVFASEYSCPVPHRVLFEKAHALCISGQRPGARTERLFRVLH